MCAKQNCEVVFFVIPACAGMTKVQTYRQTVP